MPRQLIPAVLFAVLLNAVHAAPPPELAPLQQQYAFLVVERVTSPYEVALTALNTKFTAALDNAIAQAKSSGDLPAVLAIQGDKKLLADNQSLPEDDEKTPESLKKLRAIYRDQLAKLTEQKTANSTALLTPYAVKLKELEATLTKADRIAEAQEVLTYREGLKADAPTPAPPAVATTTGAGETKPAMPAAVADDPKFPKADERQAADWVLGVGGSIVIQEGNKASYTLSSKAGLPKGKFQILEIVLDGKKTTGPVTGESLKVLAGLRDLQKLVIDNFELADEELSFVGTFPNLTKLDITHNSLFTGSAAKHFASLRLLTYLSLLNTSITDDSVALLADCKALTSLVFGTNAITDACIPFLGKVPKLNTLNVSNTKLTAEGLGQLKTKFVSLGFNLVPGESLKPIVTVLAPKQPQLTRVMLSYTFPNDTLSLLKDFPKLTGIDFTGSSPDCDALLDGLDALPGLTGALLGGPFKITDAGLMKFVPLKKLKKLDIKSTTLTEAGIAAFQKARPDVVVKR